MQVGAVPDASAVVSALRDAAQATGSDFQYLLGTALRESGLKADAHASTSSAAGLFQFVDQTWLGLIKAHGAKYGLGALADAIHEGADGRYRADPAERQAILSLRNDPRVAALMAGEYSRSSAAQMRAVLGRPICRGELYAAHFLGPTAACRLIRTAQDNPGASAAAAFPAAAAANRNVFFHADGSARSVREVYDWAMGRPGATKPAAVAAAGPAQTATRQAAVAPAANIESLLADVMNWQPSGFFASGPVSPLMLSPGLLALLART